METGTFSPNPPTAMPGPSDGEGTPHRSRESRWHSCSSQLFSALVFSRICTLPASPGRSAGKPPSASLRSKAAKPPCSRGSFPGCRRAVPPLPIQGRRGSPSPHARCLASPPAALGEQGAGGGCRSPPLVLPVAPRRWAGSRRRLLGAAAGAGGGGGQPCAHAAGMTARPVTQGHLSQSCRTPTSAAARARGGYEGPRARCRVPGRRTWGCRGDAEGAGAPLLLVRTSTQGRPLCDGSWGARPFPPQLPAPLLAGGTQQPGAAQGQPTQAVPAGGGGAMPAGWLQASRATLSCQPRPLGLAGRGQPWLPPPVLLPAPQPNLRYGGTGDTGLGGEPGVGRCKTRRVPRAGTSGFPPRLGGS